jgi:hypothetical protein
MLMRPRDAQRGKLRNWDDLKNSARKRGKGRTEERYFSIKKWRSASKEWKEEYQARKSGLRRCLSGRAKGLKEANRKAM